MCSIVLLRRAGHRWPLIIGSNRDEMAERNSSPPGRHWPDRPGVIAPRDDLAGGTWLGVSDRGLVAAVLNRRNTLGPEIGRRSRGELPLIALSYRDAREAVNALSSIDTHAYRSFNMIVGDSVDAYWLSAPEVAEDDATGARRNAGWLEINEVPPGVSMITAYSLNDRASPRIRYHLPRFAAALEPDPDRGDWEAWAALLASRESEAGAGAGGAMTVVTESGFGTTSSSLIALSDPDSGCRPVWLFSNNGPGERAYHPVLP